MSSDDEDEISALAVDPFARPADVRREDLLPLMHSQENILSEIKVLRSEVDVIRNNKTNPKADDIQVDSRSKQCSTAKNIHSPTSTLTNTDNDNSYSKLEAILPKIQHLEDRWSKNEEILKELSSRLNDVEQYGRLYNLIIQDVVGVPYKLKGIPFSKYVVWLLNSLLGHHLSYPICLSDIDKSHPLYKKSNGKYVLIVRFVRRDVRDDIFYKLKNLPTQSGVTITENLTAENLILFKSAKQSLGEGNVFTDQCRIYSRVKGKKVLIKNEAAITEILCTLANDFVDEKPTERNITVPVQKVNGNDKNSTVKSKVSSQHYYNSNTSYNNDFPALIQKINNHEISKGPKPHLGLQYDENYYYNNPYNEYYWGNSRNHGGYYYRGTRGRNGYHRGSFRERR